MNLTDYCEEALKELKFRRSGYITFSKNLFKMLCTIVKEVEHSKTIQLSPELTILLRQITFTVQFYNEICSVERKNREVMLDGHKFCHHNMTKSIENLLGLANKRTGTKENRSGSFLRVMDTLFEKIYEIQLDSDVESVLNVCDDVMVLIKEVLCSAYAVALVVSPEDQNSIKGASQTVIDCLDSIKAEISKKSPSSSMCDLLVDSLSDNLCSLERKVNAGILELTLVSFSNYHRPICELFELCSTNTHNLEKEDQLVGEVDLLVDKIVQIAWFAISCTTESKHELKLRNCLATVEMLERELVPNILMMCKTANISYSGMIKNKFLSAVDELKVALFNILDPCAFCQIVEKAVNQFNCNLRDLCRYDKLDKNTDFDPLLFNVFMMNDLLQHLVDNRAIKTCSEFSNAREDVIKVLYEILGRVKPMNGNDLEFYLKVLKRCTILQHEIHKLVKLLSTNNMQETTKNQTNYNPCMELSVQASDSSKDMQLTMKYIEERTKKIIFNRSLLKTPQNKSLKLFKSAGYPNIAAVLKVAQKRNVSFANLNVTNTSGDLDITDILRDLDRSMHI